MVSVGPERQAMGTLHHDASVVDWPEKLRNMILCDSDLFTAQYKPWWLLCPSTDPSLPGPEPSSSQAVPGEQQSLIKEQASRASPPIATLVPLPPFLTVQHLELCQLKLFLPLNNKCISLLRENTEIGLSDDCRHTDTCFSLC